jgi:hypothetical protein
MDTTTIFLFFVVACIGAAIGGLVQRSLDARRQPPAEDAANPPGTENVEPTPAEKIEKSLASEGDIEVLRAWRMRTGKVWLEMDKARLENKEALDPAQRRKLLELVLDLRPWLELSAAAAPEPAAQPAAATPPPVQPTAPVVSPPPPTMSAKPVPTQPVVKTDPEEKPKISMKSIVEQIDDVLQAKLSGTAYVNNDIHLLESPGGGVVVQVDLRKFEGIDAVPDAGIKDLIRLAVSEWEKGSK